MSKRKAVDRSAAVPLYHQIYLQLRDEILDGRRAVDSAMPTEHELSVNFKVSRITARRVLHELAAQGFVARKRRVGTTVIFRAPARPIAAKIDQAVDSLLGFGHLTKARVLEIKKEPATAPVGEALNIAIGEPVLRAVRVRSLDGAPLGYIVSYIRAEYSSIVTRAALSKKPILEIIQTAGHRIDKATQTIAATLADPTVSTVLAVEPRSAILRIDRIVYDADGRPFLLTHAHYRSDRYHLRIDLQP